MSPIENVAESRARREEAIAFIKSQIDFEPDFLIILGTGLGRLAEDIDVKTSISYSEIPHFPTSTVESHVGKLLFGELSGKKVVAMQGRFHYYEGYTMQQIVFPVRVLNKLGAGTLIVSNACGGMNPGYRRGDIMCITDHINMLGVNPLIGPNDDELGGRYLDMSELYSPELVTLAENVALKNNIKMHQGVYIAVPGPILETRAEYRFLRLIGGDVVGMSTVPEVIAAGHMGMKVLGISVITDECFPDALEPVDIPKIFEAADIAEPKMTQVVKGVLTRL